MQQPPFAEVLAHQIRVASEARARPARRKSPWPDVATTWRRAEILELALRQARQADCYRILGVSEPCSLDDVKRAFRARALETHPDRPGGSHQAFRDLFRAY